MEKLTFIKVGGSLITDERRARTVRMADLQRVAREIAAAAVRLRGRLIVGHGSGSFGHPAAQKARLVPGRVRQHRLAGVSTTQLEARQLHTRVLEALDEAGLCPFSLPPSAFLTANAGRPAHVELEPLLRSLDLGLVPVLYGDIVMDREWGACVASTEDVFLAVISRLRRRRIGVRRVVWAGETDGVLDSEGKTRSRISPRDAAPVLKALEASSDADVAGGIRHRVRSAVLLARRGITSWIVNGRREGLVGRALVERSPAGTRVAPDRK